MTERKCPNCGAPVPSTKGTCEYCGTQFEENSYGMLVPVLVERPDLVTLTSKISVDDYAIKNFGEEYAHIAVICEMERDLARKLIQFMEVQARINPETLQYEVRSRVRVVAPKGDSVWRDSWLD